MQLVENLISGKIKMKTYGFVFSLLVILTMGCREPFEPEIDNQEAGILVVEGYLDSEGLKSELKLSVTTNVSDTVGFVPVKRAIINLISGAGSVFPLVEDKEGVYHFEQNIDENQEYKLEILLANGDKYVSSSLKPIITPPIQEAGYVRDEQGVEVFVNTKGDENADDFLWTFEETWIYLPRFKVTYIYKPALKDVVPIGEDERIDLCYKSESNSDILLETSSRFEEQVVFRKTITEIPEGDERLMERYSILISQKAIPQESLEFWETLKKNTDDIGSIFSPLPSVIGGNFKLEGDPDRSVIGFVSLGVVRQERVYIDRMDVLPWEYNDPEFDDCIISQDTVFLNQAQLQAAFASGAVLPARSVPGPMGPIGYYSTPRRCGDCTLYADRKRPEFWED
jgi:Domain of unknown function (DUF4249)